MVDFPVEIVGRDNLVRRYSYDEAVRLYQRRIQSASVRYDDPEMIDAEVHHCRQRIDQLRRSYLEHAGWGWARASGVRGILGSPLAAEVAAFLRRAFADDPAMLGGLALTLMETGPGDVCFLKPGRGDRSFLLYAWRLDAEAPPGARADFERTRERLDVARAGNGGEHALMMHLGPDLAIILAGEGEWEAPSSTNEPLLTPLFDVPAGEPWREATRALHDGDLQDALRRFEEGMEQAPARPVLAQSAAIIALQAHDPERAEFAARYGLLHHRADPLLSFLLAVAQLRQRDRREATRVLAPHQAGEGPAYAAVHLVCALLAVTEGRLIRAWRGFRAAEAEAAEGPWYIVRAARTARLGLLSAVLAGIAGVSSIAPAVALAHAGRVEALLGVGVTLAGAAVVATFLVRVRRALLTDRYDAIRLVSPELLPREPEPDFRN